MKREIIEILKRNNSFNKQHLIDELSFRYDKSEILKNLQELFNDRIIEYFIDRDHLHLSRNGGI